MAANLQCCKQSKLTAEELTNSYLFGIYLGDPTQKAQIETQYITQFIDMAYDYVENLLDVSIVPKEREDYVDFYGDQAKRSYWLVNTLHAPILYDYSDPEKFPIQIEAFYGAGLTPAKFPTNWLRVQPNQGQIHVYPTAGSLGSFMHQFTALNTANAFYGYEFIPGYFHVKYISGMCPIPPSINNVVAKIACIGILNVLGDILLGAGIANYSLSLDGLSQSIGTTQSAENSSYSARIKQYQDELRKDDIPLLKARYGSINFSGI